MVKHANRAKMTTATTGTGTITLGSAADGYQSFADAGVSNGDTVRYVLEDGANNNFEIGTGTYTSSGTTLSRSVTESSNSDSAINLSGSASVFLAVAAQDLSPTVTLSGAVTGSGTLTDLGDVTIATTATSDPTITLSGAVTGSGTMTNLGNVSISTTATADPTLTLSGDASGSATFTNLGNATLSVTVADDSHNHVISNVDGLQSALDGKLSTSGTAANSTLLDSLDSSQFLRSDAADSTSSTISFTGDIEVGDQIIHSGDNDTYLQFHAANQFRIVTGGTEMLEVNDSTVQFGAAANLNGNLLTNVEDIYLRDKIFHDGDTNTHIGFATDQIELTTGGYLSLHINGSGTFVSNGSLKEQYVALSGTSPTCNVDNGAMFSLTMSGNTTFTFSGADTGYSNGFILQLTGNGGTVTYPNTVDFAGGTAPDAPASGETDILCFISRDGGSTWYGALAVDAAA